MGSYGIADIRNIAMVGHAGCGKTTLVETLLYQTNAIGQPGSIKKGNTVCDYESDEKQHQHSCLFCVCENRCRCCGTPWDCHINGDLAARRGQLNDTNITTVGFARIFVQVPLAELEDYQSQLKSLTAGEGMFTMELSGYQAVSPNEQSSIKQAFLSKKSI